VWFNVLLPVVRMEREVVNENEVVYELVTMIININILISIAIVNILFSLKITEKVDIKLYSIAIDTVLQNSKIVQNFPKSNDTVYLCL